jgi:hypothetical protein
MAGRVRNRNIRCKVELREALVSPARWRRSGPQTTDIELVFILLLLEIGNEDVGAVAWFRVGRRIVHGFGLADRERQA